MFSPFVIEALAKEDARLWEESVQKHLLINEAVNGFTGQRGSKILVKLGRLLIQTGEYLLSHTERDLGNRLSGATLQKM